MPGPLPRWFDRVRLPVSSPVTSAFPKSLLGRLYHDIPLNDFRAGRSYAAAVIRLSSGLRVCLPPRSSPPLASNIDAGRPWRLHPSKSRFVASPRIGHTSRPNRAIDGRGLSPPRSTALLAATRLSPPVLCRLNWRTRFRVKKGQAYRVRCRSEPDCWLLPCFMGCL